MTVSFAKILAQLPQLSQKELAELRTRLDFLAPLKGEKDDWLLLAVLEELNSRGLWPRGRTVPAHILPKDFAAKSALIKRHLLLGYRSPLNQGTERRTELLALGRLGAAALANWLTRAKVPVTPKTVLANLDKIPEALENDFPGYWGVHGLSLLVKRGA